MTACEIAVTNVERITQERDGIELDRDVMEAAAAIDALQANEARYLAALDIAKRQSELAVITSNLKTVAERLDRPNDDPSTLVLPVSLVGKLRGLIDRRSGIRERLQSAVREHARAAETLTTAQQTLETLDASGGHEAAYARLQLVLDQARASDHTARQKAARRIVADLTEKRSHQLAQLRPWAGEIGQLELVTTPTSDQVQDWRNRGEAIRQALLKHGTDLENLTSGSIELAAKIDAIKEATGLVDDATALASRAERNDAWRAHRETLDAASADHFEAALHQDDHITGAQIGQTGQAADLRQAVQSMATATAKLQRTKELNSQSLELKAALDREIAAVLFSIGLPSDMRLSDFDSWLSRRASALELNAGMKAATADLREAQADEASQIEKMMAALTAASVDAPDATFDGLLIGIHAIVDRDKERRAYLASSRKNVESVSRDAAARKRDLDEAQGSDREWQQAWNSAVGSCWLGQVPSPPGPDEINQILTALAEIPPLEVERDGLTHRIEAMRRDQDQFVQAVQMVSENLDIVPGDDPLKLAASLRRRLDVARSNAQKRAGKQADLDQADDVHRKGLEAIEIHTAEASKLLAFFGVDTLVGVSAKIEKATRRVELERQLKLLSDRVTTACRTERFEDAEAALADLDQAQLEAEAATVSARLEDQDREAHELHGRFMETDRALTGIGGDDAVARLDEERRTLLMELEELASQYLRLKLGIAAARAPDLS
ncbi:hypothetical protein AB4099_27240 [Bosea sp. 2KB_26]|uniref:hypothetical protein n=1 Tax=Bosea sp. 2KB_26 TaxID=3237475 RepID=UPI003F8EA536